MEKNKMKEKKWLITVDTSKTALSSAEEISQALGVSSVISRLLYGRGYTTPRAAKAFLYMETEQLSDPYLLKDISPAAERVIKAIRDRERITVYGDYDVDGVTSVCTLYLYLKSKGATVDYYIPNRAGEGYGVSCGAIDILKERGTSLIITVDTGITADREVLYGKELGIDFVITDHHEQRQSIPEAVAVVNPHRQDCPSTFKELAGVGVVFKLLCVIESKLSSERMSQVTYRILKEYSDLIAIGTIADVMQIREENRIIVKHGLSMIENTKRPGLTALIEASLQSPEGAKPRIKKRPKITSSYIGFTLAPRINAAGRIRSASIAAELFLSDNETSAKAIAEELCLANKERQNEENRIINDAYAQIEAYGYDKMPVIVLSADSWHHGVIGIVSSRITEKYSKPSILVSFEGCDCTPKPTDPGKGSGRSIKGMNLVDALVYCQDLLIKFGGHELAAGLSVSRENLDEFRRRINEYASKTLTEDAFIPTLNADLELKGDEIDMRLCEELRLLEPFGVGNPTPSFVMKRCSLSEIAGVSDGKHTRLTLHTDGKSFSCMFFSKSPSELGVCVGDFVDILFTLDINEYNGRRSVQIIIKDIRLSEEQKPIELLLRERFDEIWAGAEFTEDDEVLPVREDFAILYRFIITALREGKERLYVSDITSAISRLNRTSRIGYIKVRVMIKVMQEMNLLSIAELSDDLFSFAEYKRQGKVDLEKSNLLRKLRSQLIS